MIQRRAGRLKNAKRHRCVKTFLECVSSKFSMVPSHMSAQAIRCMHTCTRASTHSRNRVLCYLWTIRNTSIQKAKAMDPSLVLLREKRDRSVRHIFLDHLERRKEIFGSECVYHFSEYACCANFLSCYFKPVLKYSCFNCFLILLRT